MALENGRLLQLAIAVVALAAKFPEIAREARSLWQAVSKQSEGNDPLHNAVDAHLIGTMAAISLPAATDNAPPQMPQPTDE